MATCVICGNTLDKHRRLTCNDTCHAEYRALYGKNFSSVHPKKKDAIRYSDIKRPVKAIETDAEQERIRRDVDTKLAWKPDPGRSLKGTPDWDRVVTEVTRLDRIRRQNTAAIAGAYHTRRTV